ncbi:hypothetical protein BDW02DRAFT_651900 [Decorospora gaudefroyi]|uniref:Uncharacterized protein n=1 Tax=Decorospora gaudefroyi TaxID=184978 RepID=A0A6A5K2I3_9PLEO|nr:hypothetical protein BDW02DRAFT_651900 [Decorospora gaudefroyi]
MSRFWRFSCSLVLHSSFMTPLLYYAVPATSNFLHILFIVTYNITSVQSFNSSCTQPYDTLRHIHPPSLVASSSKRVRDFVALHESQVSYAVAQGVGVYIPRVTLRLALPNTLNDLVLFQYHFLAAVIVEAAGIYANNPLRDGLRAIAERGVAVLARISKQVQIAEAAPKSSLFYPGHLSSNSDKDRKLYSEAYLHKLVMSVTNALPAADQSALATLLYLLTAPTNATLCEREREKVAAISCCLCSRTVHALLRQGGGQKGRKRLGQQPSHVTSGSARYTLRVSPSTSGLAHRQEVMRPRFWRLWIIFEGLQPFLRVWECGIVSNGSYLRDVEDTWMAQGLHGDMRTDLLLKFEGWYARSDLCKPCIKQDLENATSNIKHYWELHTNVAQW